MTPVLIVGLSITVGEHATAIAIRDELQVTIGIENLVVSDPVADLEMRCDGITLVCRICMAK